MKLYTAAALIAMAALTSCAGDDNKEYVDKSIMPTAEEKAAAQQKAVANATTLPANTAMPVNMPANIQPQGKPVTIPGGQPVMVNPQARQSNVVMTPVQTPVQPTAPGMNPPHGQPNHRCDIAVGAPLNSKPAPATTGTTVNTQPQQVTMTPVANKVKTAPGMNPPHGEPGHRCDIAVGAPLNSKPAPATVTTVTAPPPLLTPAKTDSTKN